MFLHIALLQEPNITSILKKNYSRILFLFSHTILRFSHNANSIYLTLGQARCNHTFTLLAAWVKKKNSPPLSHHQHRSSTHGSTSLRSHGERWRAARLRWPPGPWWSGVSPRWHSRRAAECKQDTGGWRDGGMEGWKKRDGGMRMWSQQPLHPARGRGKPLKLVRSRAHTNFGPPWDSEDGRVAHITAELITLKKKIKQNTTSFPPGST